MTGASGSSCTVGNKNLSNYNVAMDKIQAVSCGKANWDFPFLKAHLLAYIGRIYSSGHGIFNYVIFFNWYSGGGFQLGPLGTAATNRPIVPAPSDYDDGEIGGMIGGGNRSTRRKPAPVPLCPPQTPHADRTRTRAAEVGSQRLTAWPTARPFHLCNIRNKRHGNCTHQRTSVPYVSQSL
jgi:hypothetical protein